MLLHEDHRKKITYVRFSCYFLAERIYVFVLNDLMIQYHHGAILAIDKLRRNTLAEWIRSISWNNSLPVGFMEKRLERVTLRRFKELIGWMQFYFLTSSILRGIFLILKKRWFYISPITHYSLTDMFNLNLSNLTYEREEQRKRKNTVSRLSLTRQIWRTEIKISAKLPIFRHDTLLG